MFAIKDRSPEEEIDDSNNLEMTAANDGLDANPSIDWIKDIQLGAC